MNTNSLQFYGALNAMFTKVMLENATEQTLLQYAIMLTGWETGIQIDPGKYYRHKKDPDGEYYVYKSIWPQSYVAQISQAPDDPEQGVLMFEKIGYVDYINSNGEAIPYRLWTQPYGKKADGSESDTYKLGELAPLKTETTVETKAFEDIQGQTVVKDEYVTYVIDGEKHLYKIGVNQVTVSSQYVTPDTPDNSIYIPVEGTITYTDTTANIIAVDWYESLDPDNDNRWHPTTPHVWRKI